MKPKPYIAKSDAEAQGLHDGSIGKLVIPFTEQPPKRYTRTCNCGQCRVERPIYRMYVDLPTRHWTSKPFEAKAPYAPGDRIAVKEVWMACLDSDKQAPHNKTFVYRATDEPARWMNGAAGKWEPARKMPTNAVRTHLLCESDACEQVDGQWSWIVKVKKET